MNENVTMMETLEWLIQDYDAGSSVALSVVSLRMIINEHAALKRENEMLREFVELTQSKWEEFGCDDGVVTVKYPWAIQERMREIALLIEEQEK